jgi:hypothetical protein
MHLLLALATLASSETGKEAGPGQPVQGDWQEVVKLLVERMQQLIEEFRRQRVTPAAAYHFEQQVEVALRELGRQVAQWTYNHVEPAVDALAKHVWFEASAYTRLNAKTPQNAWTRFGQIRLWRIGYRPTSKTGDATLFPLALSLGLVGGATPALAERAARLLSATKRKQDAARSGEAGSSCVLFSFPLGTS